ncbi:MAG: hypothetical protein NC084_10480 [Bacteroides sp.]|nr:hypothetical protein [Bacteroides sp.]
MTFTGFVPSASKISSFFAPSFGTVKVGYFAVVTLFAPDFVWAVYFPSDPFTSAATLNLYFFPALSPVTV